MPEQTSKRRIASTLASLAGCAIVFGSLFLTFAFPQLHIGIAITIGAALGMPLIVLGLRLYPRTDPAGSASTQFLPTRVELRRTLWGVLGFISVLACVVAPLFVFGALFYLLPTGDGWLIVVLRMMCVLLAIGGSLYWFEFASTDFPERFRGKVSDKAIDAWMHEEPAEEPASIRVAVLKYWPVALIAATAFCVAFGIVDFDNPWLDLDAGPKRFRGIARVLAWCRGNPNTVTSSSWLIGIGATIVFATRIRGAYKRGQMTSLKKSM